MTKPRAFTAPDLEDLDRQYAEEAAGQAGGNGSTPPQAIRDLYWTVDDIAQLEPPECIIEGLLHRRTKALNFGESDTYKTFHAVDQSCRIAHGMDYHGLAIKNSYPACFIANEDRYGLAVQRVQGWHRYYGKPSGRVIVIRISAKLDVPDDIQKVLAATADAFGTERPIFIVDTWDRSISGNPNSTEDINPALSGLDTLLAAGELCLTISHSPWSDKNRTKGGVTFWANHDTRLKSERDENTNRGTLEVLHHKNAKAGLKLTFDFEKFEFAHQQTQISTLIPQRNFDPEIIMPGKKDKLSAKQLLAYQALQNEAASTKRWDFTTADLTALWIRRGAIDPDKPPNAQRARSSDLRTALATRNLISIEGEITRLVLQS